MPTMKFTLVLVLCAVIAPAPAQRPQGQPRPHQNEATRLGLLASQFGLPAVPGARPNTGIADFVPPLAARDENCWCQPINQLCTPLRPVNLDLVTRITNRGRRPGSPGSPGSVPSCAEDQRMCCPEDHSGPSGPSGPGFAGQGFPGQGFPGQGFPGQGFPGQGFPGQGFPGQGFPGQGFPGQGSPGQCGSRTPFGLPPAISPTADFGEYPWMAVVMGPGQAYMAGGVLIADGWVLTAAHKLTSQRDLTVRLGDYDVGSANDVPQFPEFEVPVAQVIVHPEYNSKNLANDVALLQLARPVNRQQFRHITPACIPSQGQEFSGQMCFVTGWGQNAFSTAQGQFQPVLQEVDVPVVDSFRCEAILKTTRLGQAFTLDKRSFICAGGERDKDACQGDGGSPLVCGGGGGQGWTVAGLVAWGVGCGQPGIPAAYVNVPNYSGFIGQFVN